MRIDYTPLFLKQFRKAPIDIQKTYGTRIALFASNPSHPLLRTHKLIGEYEGCKSINITGDWRAIYEEYTDVFEPYVVFLFLGTHSQLYK
jgi:addiction module RelE/StbE family toxin